MLLAILAFSRKKFTFDSKKVKKKTEKMSTELKLSLDAAEYRKQLNQIAQETKNAMAKVESAVNQTAASTEKLTQSTDKMSASVAKTEKATGGLFGKIKNLFGQSNFVENFNQAAEAVNNIGSAAGVSTPAVGGLTGVVKALGVATKSAMGFITLITVALAALWEIGKIVWDKLTVSAEEFSASADAAAEHSQAILDKIKEQDAAAENYVNRLKELNDAEKLTNAAKNEMATLLKTLKGYYGDLGAEIDETTGKILNMKDVQERLEKKRADRQAGAAENVVNDLKDQALSRYMTARGDDYWTTEWGAKEEFEKAFKDKSTEEMIEFVQEKLNDKGNNATQLSTYGEVITYLREIAAKEKEIQMLKEHGVATEDELLKKQQQKTAAAEAERQKAQKAGEEADAKAAAETEAFNQAEREKSAVESAIRKRQRQIEDRDDPDGVERRLRKDVKKQEAMLEDHRKKMRNALNEGTYDRGSLEYRQDQTTELQLQLELLEAEDRYSSTVAARERKEAENLAARKKATADLLTSAGEQLELQRALVAGDQDRIAALKLEAELKAKNLDLTGEELEKLKEIRAQQGSQQLYGGMLDQAYAMQGRLREQSGDGKMFAADKALLDAEKQKGGSLTDDESRLVRDLAGLDYEIQHAAAFKLSGGIQTNALTQRGGFASGALAPDKDKINKEISANTKKIATMLDRVNDLQKEIRDKLGT